MTDETNASARIAARSDVVFAELRDRNYRATSRMFAVLMVLQWLFAIGIALVWSPYAWEGKVRTIHAHVYLAFLLGGGISSLPLLLTLLRPTDALTRHVVAVAQVFWSALLIHLSGGRIETHFHVFVSLAFLAFYRDYRILIPATLAVAGDHFVRGILWPESVYGITNPEWWRFFEHAFWVAFEDVILVFSCLRGVSEMRGIAARQAEAEEASRSESEKSLALAAALDDLRRSHEALTRSERLAAIGQLAASVGHELRNPLTAVRNAHGYIAKRLTADGKEDVRIRQFLDIMDREIRACGRIISDLLDFARDKPLEVRPCPLRALVDEVFELVPSRESVELVNGVPEDLPVPNIDKEQFRQVLVNLVQNGSEAFGDGKSGTVEVRAEGGGSSPWRIAVVDDGAGISPEALPKIFQPLFTTKLRGTGLGLAVVQGLVQKHGGAIDVSSQTGRGTTFTVELPAEPAVVAA